MIILIEDCGEKFYYACYTKASAVEKHLKESSDCTDVSELDVVKEVVKYDAERISFYSEEGVILGNIFSAGQQINEKDYPALIATTLY